MLKFRTCSLIYISLADWNVHVPTNWTIFFFDDFQGPRKCRGPLDSGATKSHRLIIGDGEYSINILNISVFKSPNLANRQKKRRVPEQHRYQPGLIDSWTSWTGINILAKTGNCVFCVFQFNHRNPYPHPSPFASQDPHPLEDPDLRDHQCGCRGGNQQNWARRPLISRWGY